LAASAALGGITCLVANGLSAIWIFRAYEARRPERLLLRLYGGEVLKLAVVIGVFGAAFAFLEGLRISALVAAYLFVQVASAPVAAQFASRSAPRP
jgi:ATP synthase protein I